MSMFEPIETSEPTEPLWDPDASMERVYRRGRRLRARRRMATLAGGTLLALVLVTVVAAAVGRPDRGHGVLTAGSGHGPGSFASRGPSRAGDANPGGSSPVAGKGGSSQAGGGDPNGTVSPLSGGQAGAGFGSGGGGEATAGSTGAGSRGSGSSGSGSSGSGSSGSGSSGSGAAGGAGGGALTSLPPSHMTNTTTTTPITASTAIVGPPPTILAPAAGDCAPNDLAYSTATDKSSYSRGETVSVNLVARNVSGRACVGPSNAGISASAVVRNSSGALVFKSDPIGVSCTASCAPPVLAPGQSASYGAGSWDSAGPQGTYRAVATRLGVRGSASTFKVK